MIPLGLIKLPEIFRLDSQADLPCSGKFEIHYVKNTHCFNSSVNLVFLEIGRCGSKQSGGLSSSSGALDGIIGFGQGNTSLLTQLAASGKIKKMFGHCLDNIRGGGIFAVGEIVHPEVKPTPLMANKYAFPLNAFFSSCFFTTEV